MENNVFCKSIFTITSNQGFFFRIERSLTNHESVALCQSLANIGYHCYILQTVQNLKKIDTTKDKHCLMS